MGRDIDQIREAIGADRLIYQDIEDLIEAVRAGIPSLKQFDCSCFTGEYITGDINESYLNSQAKKRSEATEMPVRSKDIVAVALHNAE